MSTTFLPQLCVHDAAQGTCAPRMMRSQANVPHQTLQIMIRRLVVEEVPLEGTEVGALLQPGPMDAGMQ